MKIFTAQKRSLLPHLLASLLWAAITITPCYAGLNEGLAAYDKADYTTALKELKPLAEKGNAKAQYKLGQMYGLGQGVAKDVRAAAEWLNQAAQQGVAEAQGILGYMYLVGDGAPQSNHKALKWFGKAANQGDAMAQYNLGVMYSGKGTQANPAKSAFWMRKAATQGYKFALSSLAFMYQEGKGTTKDWVLAHMLYGLAEKAGNTAAISSQKEISGKLSATQLQEANELANRWKKGSPLPTTSKTWDKK